MKPSLLSVSGPRSRRQNAGASAAGVSLHVHRIALQGFTRTEALNIRDTLTHELQRVLAKDYGLSQLEPGTRIAQEKLTQQQSARAANSGGAIARSVIDSIHTATNKASLRQGKDGK